MSGLSEAARQANNIIAPKQSATPGEGVTILASTTTAAATAVPAILFGRYVYLQAEGDKVWVNFAATADAAVDISKAGAGGATFALGTAKANAVPIANGSRILVRLAKGQHDYIKWQSDAAGAKLIVYPAVPKTTHRQGTGP